MRGKINIEIEEDGIVELCDIDEILSVVRESLYNKIGGEKQ